ncbi:radical SAM family heme chaperone HemW [bacterium]|nr:radical SAM family heme chaperone HemW [bacterium]
MTEYAYIHIPFCKSKCKYCSFTSFTNDNLITPYVYSLLKEIETNYEYEPLKTLYIGGGTPSILPLNLLEKIIKKFHFSDSPEITIETNPCDITEDYLESLYNLGINRISVGVQTFDDNVLKIIGRRHDSKQALSALELIKNSNIKNYSADLIYGLPSQTEEIFKNDLKTLLECEPNHISLYGLKIEENCYFFKNPPQNLPDDDFQADLYLYAVKELGQNGYEHYEISNFAKPDYFSRHNMNYWNNEYYYGFGVSAHGYSDGIRYNNTNELQKYIDNPTFHEYGKELNTEEKLQEEIFLGFRRCKGISVSEINEKFGIDFENKYAKPLKKYSEAGFIEKENGRYKLSLNGVLLSNIILSDFM